MERNYRLSLQAQCDLAELKLNAGRISELDHLLSEKFLAEVSDEVVKEQNNAPRRTRRNNRF